MGGGILEERFVLRRGGMDIPCCLTASGTVRRVVLGVHGFGGSKEDPIQKNLAEEMALFSGAAFRFDFPAHGESPVEALTLEGCIDTLVAVAEETKARYPQVADLCLFATGFGAYVTLLALPKLLALPGSLRLVLQTPSVRMDETLLAMTGLTRETFWALDRYRIPTPRPLDVTYAFYESLREHSAMTAVPIPMLILHGEADDYIRTEDVKMFQQLNDQAELLIIPGATHRFLEEGAWDMVVDLTRDWFEFEQVLLM